MPVIKYQAFQSLLYRKFVSPGEHDAKKVAHALNESLSNFYNYIEGFCYCPPDLIARIYNATKDTDFLNFILDDTDLMLAPRKSADPEKSLLEETLDVAAALGDVVKKTQAALKDRRLNASERTKIIHAINASEKELEDLRQKVNGQD